MLLLFYQTLAANCWIKEHNNSWAGWRGFLYWDSVRPCSPAWPGCQGSPASGCPMGGQVSEHDYTNMKCFKSIHFPLSTFYEHPLGNFNGIHTSLICYDFCLVLDVEMTWLDSTSAAVLQAQTQSDPIGEFSWQKPWALLQSSLQIHWTILSALFPSTCYF